jgi:hypothetical protein
MRAYFHLRAKHGSIPDLEGVEVTDLEQARAAALELLFDLWQEDAYAVRDLSGWSLEAADAHGRVLFSLDFDRIASVALPMTHPRNLRRLGTQ